MNLKLLVLTSAIVMMTSASAEIPVGQIIMASQAPATIKVGDKCDAATGSKSVNGADVLSCRGGAYVLTSRVGTTPVQISVAVIENKGGVTRVVNKFKLSTVDGMPVPLSMITQRSLLVQRVGSAPGAEPEPQDFSEGITALFTPVLKDDGLIDLEVAFDKREIESVQYQRQGEKQVAYPQTRHFSASNNLRVHLGGEAELKIGGSEQSLNRFVGVYETMSYDYTMKIKVSKL